MEVFTYDFSLYSISLEGYFGYLEKVLRRYKEVNLIFNWEKYHFMVQERVVLGHVVSYRGIEIDMTKVKFNEQLPPLR